MLRLVTVFTLITTLFFSVIHAVHAATVAGTKITNQAEVTYFDPSIGKVVYELSNYSSITVANAPAVSLEQSQQINAVPAQNVNLSHILINDGNLADRFDLIAENLTTDDLDLANLVMYHDINENGVFDLGEKPITTTPLLQPGQNISLVINGDIAADEELGKTIQVSLIANSQNASGNLSKTNIDTITLIDGAVFRLSNNTNLSCNVPLKANDTLVQQIDFTNIGSGLPKERDISIAGNKESGVLLESELPHGFKLEKDNGLTFAPEQGQVLVMRKDDLAGQTWIRLEDWDNSDSLIRIALMLPAEQMEPTQSGKLIFTIALIETSTQENIIYSSGYVDEDGDGRADFISNQVCNSIAGADQLEGDDDTVKAEIRFLSPLRSLRRAETSPDFRQNEDFEDSYLYHLSDGTKQGAYQGYEETWDGVYLEVRSTSLAEYLYQGDARTLQTTVTLASTSTGDNLRVVIMEVWPNSGIFRSLSPIILSEKRKGNFRICSSLSSADGVYVPDYSGSATECVLNSVENDALRASVTDPRLKKELVDIAVVEPYGRVFDSSVRRPIAGAKVTFYDENGSVAIDPDTLQPIETYTTEDNGEYPFPLMQAGKYYVDVEPPASYTFPSTLEAGHFPAWNVNEYSHGRDGFHNDALSGLFELKEGDPALRIDVPVDPVNLGNRIVIQKTASEPEVSVGSFITYTIRIKNQTDVDLYTTKIHDRLPYGFKYIPSSLVINGESAIEDPDGGVGPDLTFWIGEFLNGSEHEIRYILEATAGAIDSDGVNTAYAEAVTIREFPLQSQDVHARVKVKNTGVLSNKAILFGKVAMEKGCDQGSLPIGGVKLYMEDGTYVITDGQGYFSLYGLNPGLHVLKVDNITLPRGVKLKATASENAGDPDSRFVDLSSGDFHRADFIASCPTKKIIKESCTNKEKKVSKMVTRRVDGILKAVHFNSGKHDILVDDVNKLDHMIKLLKDKKNVRVNFVGHTDSQQLSKKNKKLYGSNQGLSEARAKQVANVFKPMLQLSNKQIVVSGKGDTQPVASNETSQGMAQNRRVEIEVLYDEPVTQVTNERHCTEKKVIVSDVFDRIRQRNAAIDDSWKLKEISQENRSYKRNDNELKKQAGLDGDISSGLLQSSQGASNQSVAMPKSVKKSLSKEKAGLDVPKTKELVKLITNAQAKKGTWVWPKGDTSLDGRFMVIVPVGAKPTLYVNNKAVSNKQLGEHIINKREKAQILAWYGVELREGTNHLRVSGKGPFGNERVLAERTFKRPAAGSSIKVIVDNKHLTADGGRSTLPVTIKILDKNGYLARGIYFVTLQASDGEWVEPDIQGKILGHQVKISYGQRTLHLRSTSSTGQAKIKVSTGEMHAETDFAQVSEIRPLIATGLVHIRARRGSITGGDFYPSGIEGMSDAEVHARSAVFMKGLIKGGLNLTLSYDSEKDPDAELLRDIDPTQYYPVHGDASIRGYEAQSRSKLYAKVEKNGSSLMWGDFLTDANSTHEDLSRVQRVLTGANAVVNIGNTRLQAFVSEQQDYRAVEEFRGNGTALNYDVIGNPIVANSEIIEIITRDRDNTGLVIKSERLTQFTDYTLDEVSGRLAFHRVIPSVDDELNPVFIRVSYDRESNGEDYLVAGARIVHKFTDNLSIGVSTTEDQHEDDGYNISGGYLAYDSGKTKASVTGALMAHDNNDVMGKAVRASVSQKWSDKATTKVTVARANIGFTSNTSGISPDRQEMRLTHNQKLTDKLTAKVDAISSEALTTGEKRQSIAGTLTTDVAGIKVKAGMRHIQQSNTNSDAEPEKINTVIVGAEKALDVFGKKGRISAEYEQDVSGENRKRVNVGGELKVTDKATVYGRYEIINSLAGINELSTDAESNTFVFGVKANLFASAQMFSEYRVRDVISGRDLESASGIKGTFDIKEGLAVSPSIEVVKTLEGESGNDTIALSLGLKDTRDKDSKKLLRLETRQAEKSDYYGFRGSYASRINDDWSALVREDLSLIKEKEGDDTLKHHLTVGAAQRPKENDKHNALYLYQWKEERSDTDSGDRSAHILSTHQNYQATERLKLSGRLAGKSEKLILQDADKRTMTALVDGKARFQLTERNNLDLELRGGMLGTNSFAEKRYSAGAGVDFDVADNMRLGVGYNVSGFKDKDLDSEEYNAKGVYVDLKFKFDEDNLGFLKGNPDDACAQIKDCDLKNVK